MQPMAQVLAIGIDEFKVDVPRIPNVMSHAESCENTNPNFVGSPGAIMIVATK
jgi:hypothetical protein